MNKKTKEVVSAFVDDTRFPGGSVRQIKKDWNLVVDRNPDRTFTVEGDRDDVEAFIEAYGIITEIEEC